jgi:LemA protein
MPLLYILLGLVGALLLYGVVTYNGFVSLRYRVNEAWSDIEVQMKRRYNLIPNVIETVKGYVKHEAGTFENVTRARNEAIANEGTPEQQAKTENMLTGALKTLFGLAEDYPELKASENFLSLRADLAEVEDKIQAARRYYNGMVRDNNTKIEQFPSNIIARLFNFTHAEFFELEESESAARRPVEVKFD